MTTSSQGGSWEPRSTALAILLLVAFGYLSINPFSYTTYYWFAVKAAPRSLSVWPFEWSAVGITANAVVAALIGFLLRIARRYPISMSDSEEPRYLGVLASGFLLYVLVLVGAQLFFVLPPAVPRINPFALSAGFPLGLYAAWLWNHRGQTGATRFSAKLRGLLGQVDAQRIWSSIGAFIALVWWAFSMRSEALKQGAEIQYSGSQITMLWGVAVVGFLAAGSYVGASARARLPGLLVSWLLLTLITVSLAAALWVEGTSLGGFGQALAVAAAVALGILARLVAGATVQRLQGAGVEFVDRLAGSVRVLWLGATILILFSFLPDQLADGGVGELVDKALDRSYLFIKAAVLWIPIGVVIGLAYLRHHLPPLLSRVLITWLLVAVPILGGAPTDHLLELAGLVCGSLFGAWLAPRLRQSPRVPAHAALVQRIATLAPPPERPQIETAAKRSDSDGEAPEVRNALPDHRKARPSVRAKRRRSGRSRRVVDQGFVAIKRPLWLQVAGIVVSGWALYEAYWLPCCGLGLTIGLAVYASLLWIWPAAWLVVVPALLPVLDLAPWTGRFFFDELDLVLLVSASMGFAGGVRTRAMPALPRGFAFWLAAFALCWLVGLAMPLWPLPSADLNAFSSYWSPYNALRVGKGLLWSIVLLVLLRHGRAGSLRNWPTLFSGGVVSGLLGVVLVALWERGQFAGFTDWYETYRVTATFSSMHTGGGHIESYLALALPFVILVGFYLRRAWAVILAGMLFLVGTYVMLTTASRAGVAALALSSAVIALGIVRRAFLARSRARWFLAAASVVGAAAVASVLVYGASGGHLRERFAATEEDFHTRLQHWSRALDLKGDDTSAHIVGNGLGTFPSAYLLDPSAPERPAAYGVLRDGDNAFLRLLSGETLYVAQRIDARPGQTYRILLDLRSGSASARIDLPLCEKHLLNSRACAWSAARLKPDGRWHSAELTFESGGIGDGGWRAWTPVDFSLNNPKPDTTVDVDNVRLLDFTGRNLVANGDFSAGSDRWFIKTHSHLAWHVKNLWISLYFELGWAGIALFLGLLVSAALPVARATWRGGVEATTAAAALVAFLSIGVFASPFDAPRLTLLFFLVLFFAELRSIGFAANEEAGSGRA